MHHRSRDHRAGGALIGELIAGHTPDLVVIACNTASTLGCRIFGGYQSFVGTVPRSSRPAPVQKQSAFGARHQGNRQARIHQALIRDFAGQCEVTLCSADSPRCRIRAECVEVSDRDIFTELRRVLSGGESHSARTEHHRAACTHYPC